MNSHTRVTTSLMTNQNPGVQFSW